MKDLCVTFEEWYIGDGTYPPLRQSQNVNLAFYIQPYEKHFTEKETYFFKQSKNSEYEFGGKVIKDFQNADTHLIVVDTNEYLFYIEIADTNKNTFEGQFVFGKGQLLIDYYIWSEHFCNYEDAPNLFYSFTIDKIRKVKIPEKFIHRHDKGFSAPTSLSTEDYNDINTEEIVDMNDTKSDTSLFHLDLKPIKEKIAKTFI
ncbi:MAG TPA: hypothetical protein VMU83_11780 [Hanamia sp.]|nr:hypothetical protein [Hanamia sp.]